MTQREFFNAIVNRQVSSDVVEFAKSQVAKLDEKNAKRRNTDSAKQTANKALIQDIVSQMSEGETYTARQIADKYSVSTQKVSALMTLAINDGLITQIDGYKPEGAKSKVKGYILASPTQAE